MPSFFGKIRKKLSDENMTLKYVRYAIGEIVLVVIGILIALSINNWNDVRKEKKIESEYLNRLTNDLKVDLMNFDTIIGSIDRIEKDLQYVLSFYANGNTKLLDTTQLFQAIVDGADYGWSHPKAVRTTFDELKSTGSLSLIKNAKLRTKIILYQENNEEENIRIFERQTDYPKATYTLIPRSQVSDFSFQENILPNHIILQRILDSNLDRLVVAQLNFSRFLRQSHLFLHKEAQKLLEEINVEIQRN